MPVSTNKGTTHLTYLPCSELALPEGVGFPSRSYRQKAGRQRNHMGRGAMLFEGLSWWMEENLKVLLGSFWNKSVSASVVDGGPAWT